MQHLEEQLESQTLYDGKIIRVVRDRVRLENGREAFREVVHHPGGVCVLALTEQQEVLLVRQFRYPYGEELLELPAGKREPGEDPRLCGIRELEEETGYQAGEFLDFGRLYPTPGYCDEIIYLFLARDLRPSRQHLDEDEFLDVVKLPLSEALAMVLDGRLPDAKTQIALLKYAALSSQGK